MTIRGSIHATVEEKQTLSPSRINVAADQPGAHREQHHDHRSYPALQFYPQLITSTNPGTTSRQIQFALKLNF